MSAEYYIARMGPPSEKHKRQMFSVAKIEGDKDPVVYHVLWDTEKDEMLCDCPNRRRGRGKDDKHGHYVREWLGRGEGTDPIIPKELQRGD